MENSLLIWKHRSLLHNFICFGCFNDVELYEIFGGTGHTALEYIGDEKNAPSLVMYDEDVDYLKEVAQDHFEIYSIESKLKGFNIYGE